MGKFAVVEIPTIVIHDPETLSWGVCLPESLLPGDAREVAMTDGGLYLETVDGRYDFIDWDEVMELVRGNIEADRVC